MSTRFNPFVEWLKIDCPTGKPTHYELLDISPAETDPRKVESAARTQLGKLNSVEPGPHQKKLDALKAEIKKAFSVINNSAQRAKYDQLLVTNPPPESAPKTDLMPPKKPSSPAAAATQPAARPVKPSGERKPKVNKRPVDTDMVPPKKVPQSDMLPPGAKVAKLAKPNGDQFDPPEAKLAATDLNPPKAKSAIPIAKAASTPQAARQAAVPPQAKPNSSSPLADAPVAKTTLLKPNSTTPSAIPAAKTAPAPTPNHVPPAAKVATSNVVPTASPVQKNSDVYSTHLNANEAESVPDSNQENVRVDLEGEGSGKRSFLMPILVVVFSAIVVGGTIYGMGLMKTGTATADKSDELESRGGQNIEKPEEAWKRNPNETLADDKPEVIDDSKKDPFETDEDPDEEVVPPREKETDDVDPFVPRKNGDEENPDLDDGNASQPEVPVVRTPARDLLQQIFTADIVDQRQLQSQMVAIKSLWLKQDFDNLGKSQLFVESGEHEEAIQELNTGLTHTSQGLQQFWRQFRRSCRENEGDIEVDGRVVGFVEAAPEHLTLKIAGTNRRYDYRFVPPGLMMAIIDRNTIDDIPTYRLQKAAYLISRMSQRPDLAIDVEELLRLSEEDGHDVHHLRLVSQFPFWMIAEPTSRPPFQSKKSYFESLIATDGFKSADEVDSTDAGGLAKSIWIMSGDLSADNIFLEEVQYDPSQEQQRRLEMLDVARQLAVRSGDTLLAMDLVNLIEYNAGTIRGSLQYETLLDIGPSIRVDSDDANWYCESVLNYLRANEQSLSASKARKVGNEAMKVAKKFTLQAFEIQLQGKIDSFN